MGLTMSMRSRIESKLRDAFAPQLLEVVDESESHRGHAGWREGGETHFRVHMVAAAMAGKSRVERQRAVNRCLRDELATSVHALAMQLRAPDEAAGSRTSATD
jgi:BolA family transcriptional regulator, general stress-responsive regulator